jgi:D-glycero-alpha-D-manno-heptose-7-phosphate kinase
VAAVALVAALAFRYRKPGAPKAGRRHVALMARGIEAAVAGVVCGAQDQLAAAFGGVNAWHWGLGPSGDGFRREALLPAAAAKRLRHHLLLAYGGRPHVSRDVNGRWVRGFLAGRHREEWKEILRCTRAFAGALAAEDFPEACRQMNRETNLRRSMTPDVLDGTGRRLVEEARRMGCAARFTGAGGGGCIWALGDGDGIEALRGAWGPILDSRPDARLLDAAVDRKGLAVKGAAPSF